MMEYKVDCIYIQKYILPPLKSKFVPDEFAHELLSWDLLDQWLFWLLLHSQIYIN